MYETTNHSLLRQDAAVGRVGCLGGVLMQEGGRWQVSAGWSGHEANSSVEDLQWSPTEDTVFASAGTDKTIRIWDTREKTKPMLSVTAHDADVNVISWNRLVTYMLASGCDDGTLKVWDLRSFAEGGQVAKFNYHRGPISSVEWSPYEGSMMATTSADNQLAVRALANAALRSWLCFSRAWDVAPKWPPLIPCAGKGSSRLQQSCLA